MMLAIRALLVLAFMLQSPEPLSPPANAHVALTAEGIGVQIYRCTPQPDRTFKWIFEAPEATMFDRATHQPVGAHSAGPTWHWNDGSEIVGKVLQTAPSADATNIPSLLIEAHSTGGPGVLAGITFVRRDNTQAGAAPSYGCDAERANNTIRVPYEATYTFYTTP